MNAPSTSTLATTSREIGVAVLGLLASWLPACTVPRASEPVPAAAEPAAPVLRGRERVDGYDILDYDVSLRLVPDTSAISGVAKISLHVRNPSPKIELAAEELFVDSVRENGNPHQYESEGSRLRIPLTGARKGETRTLEIAYHGRPTLGLRFGKDAIFTIFHTDRWLPCGDVPGDKATLTLRLTAPAGLAVIGSGDPVGIEALPGGLKRHTFRLAIPHSAYLFGFAAGKFNEVARTTGKVSLRFVSPTRSSADLQRIFAGTEDMLRFFEERAGVPYPFAHYTQVLAEGATPQELAGLAILPAGYADEVLGESREDWMIAHELAHTWWGNLVTCAGWSDFWLNEAFATFMVAAYKERRWGRDEYDREMALARRRYQRLRQKGADRPLALRTAVKSKDVEGPISYVKGSAVLNLLRYQIGDAAFWAGVRSFVRDNAGGAVSTEALKIAMETARGQRLDVFFDQWIYGAGVPDVVVRHREEGGSIVFEIEQRSPTPWTFPLQLGVATDRGRISHTVVVKERLQEVRFLLDGALRSVRADDGGHLPFVVAHERPTPMLLYQLRHEPDAAGRAEALDRIAELCKGSQGCPTARDVLIERSTTDSSRLVRKLAADAVAP